MMTIISSHLISTDCLNWIDGWKLLLHYQMPCYYTMKSIRFMGNIIFLLYFNEIKLSHAIKILRRWRIYKGFFVCKNCDIFLDGNLWKVFSSKSDMTWLKDSHFKWSEVKRDKQITQKCDQITFLWRRRRVPFIAVLSFLSSVSRWTE